MALCIGTASQKGGVSKSSIARNLAVTFALNEWEAKIMDIDLDQSTCQGWSLRRMAAGYEPAIRVETFQNFSQAYRYG
jgi:chromosome partitioning protein